MERERTLYVNGTVHTFRPSDPPADALLVSGDRIETVGSRSDVGARAAGVRRVDLDGCAVIPGFNDSHAHLLPFGLTLDQLDVSADAARSVADIVEAVSLRSRETTAGEWVHGRGYNQNELTEGRHVSRADLDPVSPSNPVVLDHTSGHVLTCNSAALRLAGITRDTPDPAGGVIDRDQHGEPTGLLKEAAMDLLRAVIPPPSRAAGAAAIVRAMDVLSMFGITSASDAWTGRGDSIEPELAMYRDACESGHVSARIILMPHISHVVTADSRRVRSPAEFDVGASPEQLRIGATKIFADGALSTRTAAMREAYADDASNRGILFWERAALIETMRAAHRAGWQIATHALGDRAVEQVVECYAAALAGYERFDHRHRIEHCMYADEPLARAMKALGIVASLQPDIYRLGDAYVAALGLQRASQSVPTGLFRHVGVQMAFSSDLPVIPGRPLEVIRSAFERVTPKGISLGPEHAVRPMDAIQAYTLGAARATHTETARGTLAPGMLADFTVLSSDPARTPLERWEEVYVVRTVVGGMHTYHA